MNNFLDITGVKWSKDQLRVLTSAPNLIILGGPGTGKTLLAITLAINYSNQGSQVAVIVFTKALRTFIQDRIEQSAHGYIRVFYEREWDRSQLENYDIIIIDEIQDFSLADILRIEKFANKGIYLFGDLDQQMYSTNLRDERTIRNYELKALNGYKTINLKTNYRIPRNVVSFIRSIYKNERKDEKAGTGAVSVFGSIYESKNITLSAKRGEGIEIISVEDYESQLRWIVDFIKANSQYKNIGILFKKNYKARNGYFLERKLYIEYLPGISESAKFLLDNGISCGYKIESEDNLVFSGQVNVNLLTIHSSKGLEFDCLILPFYSLTNINYNENLPYVAFSRSSKKLILLYSGIVSEDLHFADPELLKGKIRTQRKSDFYEPKTSWNSKKQEEELNQMQRTIETLDSFLGLY